ncbi:hypothetical protein PIB30_059611 [Stylosanthes scabra]|uniref:Uncharacterized protein n=1 Tax=Stylosanthes scabra TaxID=79078 RepID=A0ABU6ZJ29_9FABA|nr:hypothetical protein [Stylosanthes scabra]
MEGVYCSGYWARLAQIHIEPPLRRPKADTRPKSPADPHKGPTTSITGSTQDQDHICTDLVWIYPLNNRNHHRYIKRRSTLLQPSSLAPPVTPEAPNPLKVHFVHWRSLWGLPKLTMVNQDEEGVVYSDHSGDERPQNQQNQQQVDLDFNATANASQESAGRNTEAAGTQNG